MPNPFDENVANFNFTQGVGVLGSEVAINVSTNARSELLILRTNLITDANVANRQVRVTIDNGTREVDIGVLSSVIPASQNVELLFGQGLTEYAVTLGTYVVAPLIPKAYLITGGTFHIRCDNIQAGDQFLTWYAYWRLWPFETD